MRLPAARPGLEVDNLSFSVGCQEAVEPERIVVNFSVVIWMQAEKEVCNIFFWVFVRRKYTIYNVYLYETKAFVIAQKACTSEYVSHRLPTN